MDYLEKLLLGKPSTEWLYVQRVLSLQTQKKWVQRMFSWDYCPSQQLELECEEPFQCIRRPGLFNYHHGDTIHGLIRGHSAAWTVSKTTLFRRMEFRVCPFSMVGVFIAADSTHRSILCKLAAPSQARLGNKTVFHNIFLSFICSSSTADELLYLLDDNFINLGSFFKCLLDGIWYKLQAWCYQACSASLALSY